MPFTAVLIEGPTFLERHGSSSRPHQGEEAVASDIRSRLRHHLSYRSFLPTSRLLVSLAHPCRDRSNEIDKLVLEEAELCVHQLRGDIRSTETPILARSESRRSL